MRNATIDANKTDVLNQYDQEELRDDNNRAPKIPKVEC